MPARSSAARSVVSVLSMTHGTGDDGKWPVADRDAGCELEPGCGHASWLSRASIFSGRASPARFWFSASAAAM